MIRSAFFIATLFISFTSFVNGQTAAKTTGSKEYPEVSKEYVDLESGLKGLKKQVENTIASGKVPLVYFTATWCQPCQIFSRSLADDRMKKVLENATILVVDGSDTREAGDFIGFFEVHSYPSFYKMNEKMAIIGVADGGDWGNDIVENMARVMNGLVNTTEFDLLHPED